MFKNALSTFSLFCLLAVRAAVTCGQASPTIDFDRDVRPILADHCFQCHGPDAEHRQAELRLDDRASALADREGRRAVVPGRPQESELYRRVTSADPAERMPPEESGRTLSAEQIALLGIWIEQGAAWEAHWAFVAPRRPPLPRVAGGQWPVNAIDYFVLAALERQQLQLSPPADRRTLIRRLTLDLTGLPPAPDEVTRFVDDARPDAYEQLVDRLLASPRFGERMAAPWLDAARYADTSGYQNDGPRDMWRWRDWVIEALNADLPFDQFTIEQLAGDLLPDATLGQRIATGFNRNHRGNSEGGIIPAEYAVEYVVDRVDTTATVWLGLTLACARCHDHKFDPLTQREFYQFFAFFNNVPEFGRAIKEGNSPPWIKAPTPLQQAQLDQLDDQLIRAEQLFDSFHNDLDKAYDDWRASGQATAEPDWTITRGLVARFPLEPSVPQAVSGHAPQEPLRWSGQPAYAPGVGGTAARLDGNSFIDAGNVAGFGYFDKVSLAAWIRPAADSGASQQCIVSRVAESVPLTGYCVTWQDGHIHVNLVKRWLDDAIRVRTKSQFATDQWHHVCVTYDGTRKADGLRIYVDGQCQTLDVELDLLNQSFVIEEPLRIGGGGGVESRFVGLIDDVQIYDRDLSDAEARILAVSESIASLLGRDVRDADGVGARREADVDAAAADGKLRACFLERHAPDAIRRAHAQLVEARQRRREFWEAVPTVMVMQELERPRDTFVLRRGQYDQPAERVAAGLPACFPPLPAGAPASRMALARWLVDPANPLTARVAVNRYWQLLLGAGLVETSEDFGSQGTPPSHPELLDWLATELLRTQWDTKALLKTIVTSATYRQSSQASLELLDRDPTNRWLARGPRVRMSAEMIRDQALAASGLLVEQLGGPSVRPYQPEGLWQEIATDTDYQQSHGADLYRRSLYTYIKRTVAPPTMTTFDASSRETCIVRVSRTNTPLQALTLLNDVTYVECSRMLAQRVMRECGDPSRQLVLAFRLVTGRGPQPAELERLAASLRRHQARYRADRQAARELLASGEYPIDGSLDEADLAALTMVSSLILNLSEAITKE